ncbi:facilitated trehalose transporter Tret1-like [Eriocheir sinensis]|uniref:facilitated trehalose transporter Tret1-like n=1 Tax=Eriocheir sinensis TaxID=95602 RepID=UPI0021C580C3|nr:facilitated trehalose transporter Tret1-like [Eriocheir sinensis]
MEASADPKPCDIERDGPQDPMLRPTVVQVVLIILSSLAMQQFGIAYTWPNALAGDLQTDSSTLLGHQLSITPVGLDLVGSLLFAGFSLGTLPASWLVARFGRRKCFIASVLPTFFGWAFTAFADKDIFIFIGRFVSGLGHVMMMQTSKIYVAEISNTSIRGMASTYLEMMRWMKLTGFLVVAAVAIKVPWYIIACAMAVLTLVYGGATLAVPESPNFLAVQGRYEEARRILRRLRGPRADVDAELTLLRLLNQRRDGASGFAAIFKWDVLKQMAALILLGTLRSMCGVETITVHCTRMLLDTGVSLDHTLGTLVVNSAYVFGGLCLTQLVDRLGRRWSMVVSLTIVVAGNAVLGCYCYFFQVLPQPSLDIKLLSPLDDNTTVPYIAGVRAIGDVDRLFPLLCFLVVAFGVGLGIANVPLVLALEYFPTSIRAEGFGLCLTWMSACSVVMLQLYSVLVDALTITGLYWFFALAAAAALVHTLCFIRETNKCNIG